MFFFQGANDSRAWLYGIGAANCCEGISFLFLQRALAKACTVVLSCPLRQEKSLKHGAVDPCDANFQIDLSRRENALRKVNFSAQHYIHCSEELTQSFLSSGVSGAPAEPDH